jgi:hypothetical protein
MQLRGAVTVGALMSNVVLQRRPGNVAELSKCEQIERPACHGDHH